MDSLEENFWRTERQEDGNRGWEEASDFGTTTKPHCFQRPGAGEPLLVTGCHSSAELGRTGGRQHHAQVRPVPRSAGKVAFPPAGTTRTSRMGEEGATPE